MSEMPTSSGQDRSNINTTKNFNDPNYKVQDNSMMSGTSSRNGNLSDYQASNPPNPKLVDYGKKGSHRALAKLEQEYVDVNEPDSPFVNIQDPKLREIIKKLLKAERDRENFNLDPNLVTQIDHKGYSLFFSRNGTNPFDTAYQEAKPMHSKACQTDIGSNQIQELKAVVPNTTQTVKYVNTTQLQPAIDNNTLVSYVDSTGAKYTISDTNAYANQIEIPPEVNKIIQQDMLNNPSKSGERSYKIIANKNNLNKSTIKVIVNFYQNMVMFFMS